MKQRRCPSLRGLLAAVLLAAGPPSRANSGGANGSPPPDSSGASASGEDAPSIAAPAQGGEPFASAHGRIQAVPKGYRCVFAEAPLPEAVADIARAWGVPVAYFGSPSRRTSTAFMAPTAAAALLELADRTDLRVSACGSGWCLEDSHREDEPPPLAAPWAANPAFHP